MIVQCVKIALGHDFKMNTALDFAVLITPLMLFSVLPMRNRQCKESCERQTVDQDGELM